MSYSAEEGVAKTIRINSEERQNPSSTSSNRFNVNFGNNTGLMAINRVVVKHVSIPNVQYNVRPALGLNPVGNVFSYDNGSLQSITLTPGNYNINTLISALMADAQAISDGLTLVLNPLTLHIEFSSGVPISYFSQASGNSMAKLFGITADSAPAVTEFTAPGLPDLSVHPNLYIASKTLSDGASMVSATLGPLSVFAIIPINKPFGEILHYETQQEHLEDIHFGSYSSGKSLQAIDIAVYDGDANLLDLQGLDWTLIVRAYQVPT